MTNFFPFGIVFWLASWLLKEPQSQESKSNSENMNDDIGSIWKIRYYSNGKLLNNRHHFYYCDLLKLTSVKEITDETILEAAFKRHSLINTSDYNENLQIEIIDVDAARDFLLDRWNYLTSMN